MIGLYLSGNSEYPLVLNIKSGIGRNRPNSRHDVMVVQYLLRGAVQNEVQRLPNRIVSEQTSIVPPELKNEILAVDGICGPKTIRYIEYYQQFRNSHRADNAVSPSFEVRIKSDGAVDPWRFPCHINKSFSYGEQGIPASSTLQCLCFDAQAYLGKEDIYNLPNELRPYFLCR